MLSLVFTLVVIGFVVYLITNFIPMPQIFKTGIQVIIAICVILYLLQIFGVGDLPLPRVR